MSKFKAIFFDNDGLLVDTESLYYEATKEILDTIGIDIPLDWYKRALEVGNSAFKFAEARGVSQEETERLRVLCQKGLPLCQKGLPFCLKKTKNGTWNGFWERSTCLAERST